MKLNVKIYNLDHDVDVAQDWGIQAETADINTVLAQPYRIACVPAMFTQTNNFAYRPDINVDLSRFNLVIISDIEQARIGDLMQWIDQCQIKRYVIAQGSYRPLEGLNRYTTITRFWWMKNLLRMNQYQDTGSESKPYLFDVLLGARRPHRDFVMLSMQKHPRLLNQCVVSYRQEFTTGQVVDHNTQIVQNYFSDLELTWPYVSPNLDADWEVQDRIEKSISPFVPWNIYRRTWYSAICETGFNGDSFFLTEKTTKALFAGRVFVLFGPRHFLKYLREFGFQTFTDVIDEDYDDEAIDLLRYRRAFAQMLSLTQQDPVQVYQKVASILEHNRHRLTELLHQTQQQQHVLLSQHIPASYIIS